ncbi:hypothetical protein [Geothrix sp. 21YS21S-4]|uniref:hypothetical protein n=1 Tax=Geothrix sp. 21YS21S-4 TaxID=3068889 RepID=UPI0027B8B89C|nr:hypothetical protein [Geothrix sp. 21YS21S-4]
MRRIAIPLSLLFALASLAFAGNPRKRQAERPPEVYLVGAVHSLHFESRSRYSLADLQAQILAIGPDLICGEITPEAFEQSMEGYFPPEATFLAEMAPQWKIRFVPTDWRMDSAEQEKAEKEEPPSVRERAAQSDREFRAGMMNFAGASLYDHIHSQAVLDLIDAKFETIIGKDTVSDVAAGRWHERNRRIVETGLAAAGGARKIVFVFGVSHVPQLVRQLKARGIEAKIPPRKFTPGGLQPVPAAVRARWQRNLDNLKAIQAGKLSVSDDSLRKVKNSRRIQDLEKVIQATVPVAPASSTLH